MPLDSRVSSAIKLSVVVDVETVIAGELAARLILLFGDTCIVELPDTNNDNLTFAAVAGILIAEDSTSTPTEPTVP